MADPGALSHRGGRSNELTPDATLLAIRAQEDAGLDVITDGEIRRESYSNRFATALEGVDLACACKQISIETAQSHLDTSVLAQLAGKQIMVGCLDLSDHTIETPEIIVERIRRALRHLPPEAIILAPDCGMKYLPREVAFGKLGAMVEAARILRAEH